MSNDTVIPPGATLGMLGDGQLGQMFAIAAAYLGYKTAVLGPLGRESPTGHVAYWAEPWGLNTFVSDEQLDRFCSVVGPDSAVALEWENVPVSLVERIKARGISVRPDSKVLKIAQDRLLEKDLARSVGIPVTSYFTIGSTTGARVPIIQDTGNDKCILKTRRDGYDGKGQIRVNPGDSVKEAWDKLDNKPCILEYVVDFACEISVIVARVPGQVTDVYGPFENVHVNGILRKTTKHSRHYSPVGGFPKEIGQKIAQDAIDAAVALADHLDVHGLLAVEFFVLKDGTVIFNEMAPRPHNSGHLTIECSYTSQFEQYVRAVCNLPLGSSLFHSEGTMHNILGDEVEKWKERSRRGEIALHLYGKDEAKPGRKMGHWVDYHNDPN